MAAVMPRLHSLSCSGEERSPPFGNKIDVLASNNGNVFPKAVPMLGAAAQRALSSMESLSPANTALERRPAKLASMTTSLEEPASAVKPLPAANRPLKLASLCTMEDASLAQNNRPTAPAHGGSLATLKLLSTASALSSQASNPLPGWAALITVPQGASSLASPREGEADTVQPVESAARARLGSTLRPRALMPAKGALVPAQPQLKAPLSLAYTDIDEQDMDLEPLALSLPKFSGFATSSPKKLAPVGRSEQETRVDASGAGERWQSGKIVPLPPLSRPPAKGPSPRTAKILRHSVTGQTLRGAAGAELLRNLSKASSV